mmetsp:Transcript_10072/g.18983  ORF Transcript_10072/g.18983 Transcript_10072/m.18983 type:complete len:382 (+) Transcript_10072:745-1890(+)
MYCLDLGGSSALVHACGVRGIRSRLVMRNHGGLPSHGRQRRLAHHVPAVQRLKLGRRLLFLLPLSSHCPSSRRCLHLGGGGVLVGVHLLLLRLPAHGVPTRGRLQLHRRLVLRHVLIRHALLRLRTCCCWCRGKHGSLGGGWRSDGRQPRRTLQGGLRGRGLAVVGVVALRQRRRHRVLLAVVRVERLVKLQFQELRLHSLFPRVELVHHLSHVGHAALYCHKAVGESGALRRSKRVLQAPVILQLKKLSLQAIHSTHHQIVLLVHARHHVSELVHLPHGRLLLVQCSIRAFLEPSHSRHQRRHRSLAVSAHGGPAALRVGGGSVVVEAEPRVRPPRQRVVPLRHGDGRLVCNLVRAYVLPAHRGLRHRRQRLRQRVALPP